MIDDRRRVLGRVRAALAPLATREPRPIYPDDIAFARTAFADNGVNAAEPQAGPHARPHVTTFVQQLTKAGGRAFTDPRALGRWLAERGSVRGFCDPLLVAELASSLPRELTLETKLVRGRIDEYGFGITRATGAIAETGTLILDDATTCCRLGALAPWIHIAVVRPSAIHLRVADAIRALGADPYVVWCTGPSKTADVEGILIEGVHGPGEEVALIVEAT
jgi:L-lactate dehydrogenase complex protein LldG